MMIRCLFLICSGEMLAEPTRAVADDHVVDLGLVAVLLVELLLGCGDEVLVEVVAYQVDGAAAEAAAHDT